MADITADLVKKLRDATNVSMMECKRALVEAGGDMDKATKLLRERGMAVAAKKASRTANQGLIASAQASNGTIVSLIEVNSETDFVARNETFKAFVASLAQRACQTDEPLAPQVQAELTSKIAEIGENIVVRRNTRYVLNGAGAVSSYIHLGGKVGVLIEVNCEKPETAQNPAFKVLVLDLTLHVAACAPRWMKPQDAPADVVASEREIYAKQVQGKPAQVVEKIVAGKLDKFYAETCLLNQGFVKEPKQSVTELLKATGKTLGDNVTIRRYVRYQLGE